MGRARAFDEDDALEAAMHVFWRVGFEAASLPALLEATRLSRSSFYQAFGSKAALFERCLDRYADVLVAAMRSSLTSSTSGLEFVRSSLRGVAEDARDTESRRGCLVMNTANEFGQREPAIAKLVSRHIGRFDAVFAKALERAEAEGEWKPSEGHERAAVARYLVCALSGLKTMAKAGASRASIRESADLALLALR